MSNRATFRELLYSNDGYYDRYIIIEDKHKSEAYRVRKYPFSIKIFIRPNGYITRRSLNDFKYYRGFSIFHKSTLRRNIRTCYRSYRHTFFDLGYTVFLNIRSFI